MKKVGINGFGRIGRMVLRAWLQEDNNSGLEIVAVNNPLRKGQTIADLVHLLKYDSVHGRLNMPVEIHEDGFTVRGHKIKFYSQLDPANIPWGETGVDVVVDSTGVFKDKAGLGKHLHGTVKKVIMSAPSDGDIDGTFVIGVNDELYDKNKHHIISNASCTTNCLAPIAKVLDREFGIEKGLVSTCHSVTADQNLIDTTHDDPRRARAAFANMILTKTGAAKAVGEVLPQLKGKLDGMAIRVPTLDVSVIDANFVLKTKVTAEQVNAVLKKAAEGELKGVLEISNEELVSTDFIGNNHSSILDTKYTKVMDGNLVKVMAWYDNEWGYSCRVLDLIKKV